MMGQLLYFLPGEKRAVDEEVLKDLGLGHLCGLELSYRGVSANGPNGGQGLVFCATPHGGEKPKLGVYQGQRWTCCEKGKFWVGWYGDKKPGPADLERSTVVKGEAAVLGDGAKWTFPDVKYLPSSFGYDEHGVEIFVPMEKWRPVRDARQEIWNGMQSKSGLTYIDGIAPLSVCLGANYRISRAEILALQLFDEEVMDAALDAAISWGRIGPEIQRLSEGQKKTDSIAGDATETGERAA